MSEQNKIYQVPGCQMVFNESELKVLSTFFKCQSNDDLILAAQRYEWLLFNSSREGEPNLCTLQESSLWLALHLASDLYSAFDQLNQPFEHRYLKSLALIHIPDNAKELIQELQANESGLKKLSQPDAIKKLQKKGLLPPNYTPSYIEKEIQAKGKQRLQQNQKAVLDFEQFKNTF